jgi:ketose-bisphosphate aldolase
MAYSRKTKNLEKYKLKNMLDKYFKKALKNKWAVGQFNFSTLDQMKSIIKASWELKSPVILGTSRKEADFFGIEEAAILVKFYQKKKKNSFFLNLDHAIDLETIKKAIDTGYDMVHFDGSKLDINENIKETVKVLKYAWKKKVLVEGELGIIPGRSGLNKGKAQETKKTASVEEIDLYLQKTKVDLLALAIGNVHGIYGSMPLINFSLLEKIQKKRINLVFHGASGVSDNDIRKAINLGVVKINVNTELRILWKDNFRKEAEKDIFAPYELLEKSDQAVFLKVKEKIKLFKSDNKVV